MILAELLQFCTSVYQSGCITRSIYKPQLENQLSLVQACFKSWTRCGQMMGYNGRLNSKIIFPPSNHVATDELGTDDLW